VHVKHVIVNYANVANQISNVANVRHANAVKLNVANAVRVFAVQLNAVNVNVVIAVQIAKRAVNYNAMNVVACAKIARHVPIVKPVVALFVPNAKRNANWNVRNAKNVAYKIAVVWANASIVVYYIIAVVNPFILNWMFMVPMVHPMSSYAKLCTMAIPAVERQFLLP